MGVATVEATVVVATVVAGTVVLGAVATAGATGASVDSLTDGVLPTSMIWVFIIAATDPAPSTPTRDRAVAILVFMELLRTSHPLRHG